MERFYAQACQWANKGETFDTDHERRIQSFHILNFTSVEFGSELIAQLWLGVGGIVGLLSLAGEVAGAAVNWTTLRGIERDGCLLSTLGALN